MKISTSSDLIRSRKLLTGFLFLVLLGGQSVSAQSLFSSTEVGIFEDFGSFTGFTSFASSSTNTSNMVTINQPLWDEEYQFFGQGSARSAFKTLRSSAAGSFDTLADYPGVGMEVDLNDFDRDGYLVSSRAQYTETLAYNSTFFESYTSRYFLRFTGTIVGDASAMIQLEHANLPIQSWFFSQPGTYDMILTSDAFIHGIIPQDFRLTLDTSFTGQVGFDPSFGSADFGHTLEVLGIELRDPNGNLATSVMISGSSGSSYAVVPEPASFWLVFLSGVGIACHRRRKVMFNSN